ncbi:hypothetical protein F5B22DRAFT_621504 [Xylaria bambusicola]|uniref:uncharacterized protein n=1 Tax=Xylaria bambusicola TaxID=326684 RepID=UPI002008C8A3|nr:uncharacterized protein F5B22DRAFT_621504 [Xylaria bambusicola]KAI0508284.1 hypothetical protein F5B22DRAFT_621504 [Xylaria bambusicola]
MLKFMGSIPFQGAPSLITTMLYLLPGLNIAKSINALLLVLCDTFLLSAFVIIDSCPSTPDRSYLQA